MEQKQISKKENTVLTETDGLDTDRLSHFISGQQVQIRAGTRFNTVEKFGNRKNFGRFIEEIGAYDPLKEPVMIKLDTEKYEAWVKNGARPTDKVRALFNKVSK